jgi:uncharacterized sporulation protein YeaH/YhbH (DUF444 family)
MMEKRSAKAIEQVLQGKKPARRVKGGGIQAQLFPVIPRLALDRSVFSIYASQMPPAPISSVENSHNLPLGVDDGVEILQGRVVEGDVVKRPKPEPGEGDGEGEGEGEDGEGDPVGEDEGDVEDGEESSNAGSEGSGSGQPMNYVSKNLWRDIITDDLEMPVIRRTDSGENKLLEPEWAHSQQGDLDPLDVEATVEQYFENGMARAFVENQDLLEKDQLTDEDLQRIFQQALQKGPENTPVEEHWAQVIDETPEPAYDVHILFVMDASGSMGGEKLEVAKDFVDTVRHLMRRLGFKFKVTYIQYDTQAKVVRRKEFFGTPEGGGTLDSVGFQKANQVMESIPRTQNIRMVFTISDGDSTDANAAIPQLEVLEAESDYLGMVYIDTYGSGMNRGNLPQYKQLVDQSETADLVRIDSGIPSFVEALRTMFRKRSHAVN